MASKRARTLDFYVSKEFDAFAIRRHIITPEGLRKSVRLPKARYQHLAQNREVLQAFVDKLNYGEDLKKRREIEIESAFLPPSLMAKFETELQARIPDDRWFRYCHNKIFKEYFLNFFVNKLHLPNPSDWLMHQTTWGLALLSKPVRPEQQIFAEPLSPRQIKKTVQNANRFLTYLHQQMPIDYPLMKLAPYSLAALKTYEAEWRASRGDEPVGRFIVPADWIKIDKKLPGAIAPFVRLAYHYGLRAAESLGFYDMENVWPEYLKVSHQLETCPPDGLPRYKSFPKDKDRRKTPHWFAGPQDAYSWIQDGLYKKMHPDTLSDRWKYLMTDLELPYHTHDLRRTFITRALRKYPSRDVQLAVGHADLRTTMGYAQDDREFESTGPWKPGGKK